MLSTRRELPAGSVLFQVGEAADHAYVIENGHVAILLPGNGEDRRVVLGPGEFVGEMGLLDGLPRSATAVTLTQASLLVVTAEQISRRIDLADPVLAALVRSLSLRLRGQQQHRDDDAAPGESAARTESEVLRWLRQERDLARDLAADLIVPYLQPIVSLESRRVEGYEALARWHHPAQGLIPPGIFIPLAETSGQVADIDQTVMRQACTALARHGDAPFLSCNVSPCWLADAPAVIADILTETGFPAARLKVEVTESAAVSPQAVSALHTLRAMDISISLDDFGTGYSSFSCLSDLPLSVVKLDRSLVADVAGGRRPRAVAAGILALARELGLHVVAEGIEEEAVATTIAALGGRWGQGWLFGRPAPLETLR